MKKIEKTIQKCFKKVKVTEKKDTVKEALYSKWRNLKNKTDDKSREQLKEVENELAERYAKENFEKIKEMVGNQDNEDGGVNTGSLES